MITPTDINQATNFIWYASIPALLGAYFLLVPAALLILYKLAESFDVHRLALWRRWRRKLLLFTAASIAVLVGLVRCDGNQQAKAFGTTIKEVFEFNAWDQAGLSRLKQSVTAEYDGNFLLNVIKQNPEDFTYGTFTDAAGQSEPGIIVKPDSPLEKNIKDIRTSTIRAIADSAIAWRAQHRSLFAQGSTSVYLPFDTIKQWIAEGKYINRVSYVLGNYPNRFTPDWNNNVPQSTLKGAYIIGLPPFL